MAGSLSRRRCIHAVGAAALLAGSSFAFAKKGGAAERHAEIAATLFDERQIVSA